jgi:hypothetical protein
MMFPGGQFYLTKEIFMVKRFIIASLLGLALSGTAVVAQHPGKLGVGIVYGMGLGSGGLGGYNVGLSLKVPSLPVYWTVNAQINSSIFGIGGSGDYYFIDQSLVPNINLGWYLGLGGYLGTLFYKDNIALWGGVRVPIGLSFMPANWIEIFLEVAPNLGITLIPDFYFPHGSYVNPALGIRIWI